MVVLVAWSKVVAFQVLGSGRVLIVAKVIVGVRGTVASGVEFLGTLMGVLVRAKVDGARLSGSGGRGWDEWCEIGWCSWPR